jgi:hypothetical protein
MAQASGSFGNTGVEQARGRAMDDFSQNLSNTIGNMRFGDYTAQQGLAENALNRAQGVNLYNAGAQNQGSQFNANAGNQANQYNAGLANQVGMFNAGQTNQGALADISRNTNASLGLGTFNAGQMNQGSQFNANSGNQNSMFNAGQGNAMNIYNTGAANNMIRDVRQNAWNSGERALDRTQNQGQFDATLDRNIYNDNMGWMRTGQQDQWGMLRDMQGWNRDAINQAGNVQNTPFNDLASFSGLANSTGGLGKEALQKMQSDPALAGLSAAQLIDILINGRKP